MKRFLALFFALTLCFIGVVPAAAAEDTARLYDGADLLTDSEELALMERLDAVSATYNGDFVIATVDTVDGYSSDTYAGYFYDQNGYRNGVLLLVTMAERDYSILSDGPCADAIGSDEIDSIGTEIAPHLTDGDYALAFETFVDEAVYWVDGEINGFPFKWVPSLLISLAIGLVIALIVTGIMRLQLRSVRRQPAATEYTRPGSMRVTAAHDLFLYRTVAFHKKQSNSSSGSSGSSRNVGGGSF